VKLNLPPAVERALRVVDAEKLPKEIPVDTGGGVGSTLPVVVDAKFAKL
jgi:hypothetical protein